MKNDMNLIMESWRSSITLEEQRRIKNDTKLMLESYPSIAFLFEQPTPGGAPTVKQFLDDMVEAMTVAGKDKNVETRIEGAVKSLADKKPGIGQMAKNFMNKVTSKGVMVTISTFLSAKAGEGLVALGFKAVTGTALSAAAAKTIPFLLAAGAAIAVIDSALEFTKDNFAEAIKAFDMPDADRSKFPSADYWDIDDDFMNILKGPDKKLDREELRAVVVVYQKLLKTLKELRTKANAKFDADLANNIIGDDPAGEYNQFMKEPITNYISKKAVDSAKEEYSKMVDIKNNPVTIPKS